VNRQARGLGIEIVDVRLTRVDLPPQNSEAVYNRMRTERQREAADLRANGQREAQTIRARAEREATVIVAEATRRSEELRGQGDAERNRILAEAFQKDPDFFNFYRSMQAYEAGFRPGDTRLVLSPNSDFLRFFNDPMGRGGQAGNAAPRPPVPPAPPAPAPQSSAPAPAAPAVAAAPPVAPPAVAAAPPAPTPPASPQ
jgi:membrane protease subunit HflC